MLPQLSAWRSIVRHTSTSAVAVLSSSSGSRLSIAARRVPLQPLQPQRYTAQLASRFLSSHAHAKPAAGTSAPAAAQAASPIPIINMEPFLKGGTADIQRVASEVNRACEEIGFLTVVGHGVPMNTIRSMEELTRQFFDQPEAIKNEIVMTEDYPYGYSGFLQEKLSKGAGDKNAFADLKESFCIGPYNPLAGMPAIRWPSKPAELATAWLNYYKSMEVLASNILQMFALALGMPRNFFEDKINKHRSALRALNYPEQTTPPAPGQLRAGAHTDYGSVTILLQDAVGGLQVVTKNGQWQDVPYIPDAYVINLGDLVRLLSL